MNFGPCRVIERVSDCSYPPKPLVMMYLTSKQIFVDQNWKSSWGERYFDGQARVNLGCSLKLLHRVNSLQDENTVDLSDDWSNCCYQNQWLFIDLSMIFQWFFDDFLHFGLGSGSEPGILKGFHLEIDKIMLEKHWKITRRLWDKISREWNYKDISNFKQVIYRYVS